MEDKAAVVDKYAREKLDTMADVNIKDDDRNYFPVHSQSPLSKKFYKAHNKDKDVQYLCQDCMCHHCNKFCLQDNKKNSHVLVALALVMNNILAGKIRQVWTLWKRHNS